MSRLEDIPKKDFFRVPGDYFDRLPGRIQARVGASARGDSPQTALRYAIAYPLPLLIAAVVIFFMTRSQPDAEEILASVDTTELINYLQESDITTEEMLESVELSADDLEALEHEAYDLSLDPTDTETLYPESNSTLP